MAQNRAVFFDRDGVLNRTNVRGGRAYAPMALDDFEVLSGAVEAVVRCRAAGFLAIVITNQPELASGNLSHATLDSMHDVLRKQLTVDAIYVCQHRDSDQCVCRKPLPGMLFQAAEEWDLDLSRSFLIGDRWRDIDAGRSAGCQTLLIDRPYSGATDPDFRVDNALAAVEVIVGEQQPNHHDIETLPLATESNVKGGNE